LLFSPTNPPSPIQTKPHVPGEKLRRVEVLVLAVGCRLLAAGGCWWLLLAAFFSNENENDVTVCHD